MEINKKKISELPLSQAVTGLYTIGVDALNRSVKISLEWIAGQFNSLAQTVSSAATAANNAASLANGKAAAAERAASAATAVTTAADNAEKARATEEAKRVTAETNRANEYNSIVTACNNAKNAANSAATNAENKATLANTAAGSVQEAKQAAIIAAAAAQEVVDLDVQAHSLNELKAEIESLKKTLSQLISGAMPFDKMWAKDSMIESGNIITVGEGAPTVAPRHNGQFYVDITNRKLYFSAGVPPMDSSSVGRWILS